MTKRTIRTKPTTAAPAGLSLRNPNPVLVYQDQGATPVGVPPRDLNTADLYRIARIRALHASGGDPVPVATEDELEALATELSASGVFARNAPATKKPPVEVPAPEVGSEPVVEAPAPPADEEPVP